MPHIDFEEDSNYYRGKRSVELFKKKTNNNVDIDVCDINLKPISHINECIFCVPKMKIPSRLSVNYIADDPIFGGLPDRPCRMLDNQTLVYNPVNSGDGFISYASTVLGRGLHFIRASEEYPVDRAECRDATFPSRFSYGSSYSFITIRNCQIQLSFVMYGNTDDEISPTTRSLRTVIYRLEFTQNSPCSFPMNVDKRQDLSNATQNIIDAHPETFTIFGQN